MCFVEKQSAFVLVRNLGHRVGVASVAILLLSGVAVGQAPPDAGSIIAWGSGSSGQQTAVPTPNSGFIAIAAGGSHSMGLKTDGTIVAWGGNSAGQTDVPVPNSGFIAIAAGAAYSMGLRKDGSIVAWGANSSGQTDVPAPNSDFIAIAASGSHSIGIRADGSLISWGANPHGPQTVTADGGFIAIAAGDAHGLGLAADGFIVAWGWSSFGSLPQGNDFVAIAASGSHSMALNADGSIVVWGSNSSWVTQVPEPNSGFVAIAAGNSFSLAIRTVGEILFVDEGEIPGHTAIDVLGYQILDKNAVLLGPYGGSGQTGGGVDEFTAASLSLSLAMTDRAGGIRSLDQHSNGAATFGLPPDESNYIYAEFWGEAEIIVPVPTRIYWRWASWGERDGQSTFNSGGTVWPELLPGVRAISVSTSVEAGCTGTTGTPCWLAVSNQYKRQAVFSRRGDLNGDGHVGVADLLLLLASWGECDDWFDCLADYDGNGAVGVADLLTLLNEWG